MSRPEASPLFGPVVILMITGASTMGRLIVAVAPGILAAAVAYAACIFAPREGDAVFVLILLAIEAVAADMPTQLDEHVVIVVVKTTLVPRRVEANILRVNPVAGTKIPDTQVPIPHAVAYEQKAALWLGSEVFVTVKIVLKPIFWEIVVTVSVGVDPDEAACLATPSEMEKFDDLKLPPPLLMAVYNFPFV